MALTERTDPGRITVYDTTLRDGTQREGISLSSDDKLRIAVRLDELGVGMIEGGWPGSNPKDAEFFQRAKTMQWKNADIAAFGSTRHASSPVENDPNLAALLEAETPVCTVVGKSWSMHVSEVLRTTRDENLRMIEESVGYLRARGRRVVYDAEHFFDGYKDDAEYALETLRAAVRGGAEIVVLCDTNGGSLPWVVEDIVRQVGQRIKHPLGIHTHNDGECAVANSLAAVRAGAVHVQGTINGYGERCGNANLSAIIPDLELKLGLRCLPEGKLKELYDLSHFVAEVANLAPDEHMAYVGRSAFAHKGGIHVAAVRRNPRSYQHIDPELVGNELRVVVSELSGRGSLLSKAEELGLGDVGKEEVSAALQRIKDLEARGFSFEASDASVVMMMRRLESEYRPPFELVDYVVMVENRQGRGTFAEANVKISINGEIAHTAAEGNGPVNALDAALRKALTPVYPELNGFHLSDYKVRILDGQNGTAATTRVLIDTRNAHHQWSTVGASANIIEASWQALVDSVEYGLHEAKEEAGSHA
ncbi:MAG: citramalate synthase [Chloroflexi bacterium RBG_19FT_COMBO_62_14]|nr:MAG: citramalate synthase [Chloroflexi bacterium RBG_19FT_COMBO_62_14]